MLNPKPKAYKVRLYPNQSQETLLLKNAGCRRFVYNWGLNRRIKAYNKDKKLTHNKLTTWLPLLKEKHLWLKEADSTNLQQALRDLDKAYQNFFRRVKNGEKPGFPKFKSKHGKAKFRLQAASTLRLDYKSRKVKLGKLGLFKYRGKTPSKLQRVVNISVSQDSNSKWYCSMLVEENQTPLPKTGKLNGYDLGLTTLLTGSASLIVKSPKSTKTYEKKLKRAQQKLSKKKKGSSNYNKQKKKVGKLHFKIKSVRKDFNHKLSKQLVESNDVIVMENLCVKGLAKTKLAKSIHDASWSQFLTFLSYKCDWYGKDLLFVDRFFPSSKLCHVCGTKTNLTLSDRIWTCTKCKVKHDRDVNAARNLTLWGRYYVNGFDLTPDEYQTKRQQKFSRVGTTRFQAYGDSVSPLTSVKGKNLRSRKPLRR